ncbi:MULTISPECIES: peptidoglycan-binding protein [unclassified Streptomyces]|uniref:peptidoglycan-binding protein n=1 Tax=unclassified Streptomyces TaxID=2593676 RepID=UPI00093A645D|nr:peptidoglycan-binding protein [Streptomyces sp. TSRI0281]OKI41263.1 hypothetical protein A6A29_38005 [Streptomyces sp. TSRI0281]
MTGRGFKEAGEALMADLTEAFGVLTPDKAAAFFPGLPVDDQIVQHGTVNQLRLGQWLATFDTPLVLRPGQTVKTVPPGGRSATALYSTIVTSAQVLDADSLAGKQLTKRILAGRALLEQVALDEPLGSEPSNWPLPTAPSWQTASSAPTRPRPDALDPDNTVLRLPGLGDGDQEVTVTHWLRAVGESAEADEPLLEVSSAEGDTEIPCPASGTLLEITASEGSSVKQGDPLAVIGPQQAAPQVNVEYEYTLVSLTRLASGKPWWDDILLSDPNWFIPGRTAGGLLSSPPEGTACALPYALLLVRNVAVDSPVRPPADTENLGPVLVADTSGTLGWSGMQAIGVLANVLPTIPPVGDPAVPAPTPAHFQPFPGDQFFFPGRRSPVIAAMHDRLVAVGCDQYTDVFDKDVWGDGDVASYRAWQLNLGFSGDGADGQPGQESWDRLQVPQVL